MLHRETMYELAEQIAEHFGVQITIRPFTEFPRDEEVAGMAAYWEGSIEVNVDVCARRTKGNFISTLLHECAHVHAYRNKIFLAYHVNKSFEEMTIPELETYMRVAWRAERWVEEQAREWMEIMFPGETYWYSYGRVKLNKDWFDKVELREARQVLRRKRLRRADRMMRLKKESV